MTPSEFVELCKQLKELGATSAEAHGYKATFAVQVPVSRVSPAGRPVESDVKLSPDAVKAAQRAKELGRG